MKRRGEVWWVNFDPSVGQEVKKKRPAVNQLTTVSELRFLDRIGQISGLEMGEIERIIRIQLDL